MGYVWLHVGWYVPPLANAIDTRLGCPSMAIRMSLQCRFCHELVAAMGRDRTVDAMAQHLRMKHGELTDAEREALARRPQWPLPLADVAMVARRPVD
jgi:hypothetical protein